MKKSKKVIVLAMASMMLGTINPVVSLASVNNTEIILEGRRIIESGLDENGNEYIVYEGVTSDKPSSMARIVDTRYIERYVVYKFSTVQQATDYFMGGTKSINWQETIGGSLYKGTLKGQAVLQDGKEVTVLFKGNVTGVI